MKRINIGVIGYGAIASAVHINTLHQIQDVTVSAIADSDVTRLTQAQEDVPEAHIFTDYKELLVLPNVDGVVISLPTALHAEVALSAMANHKHVYLEKPLATNMAEAQTLVAAWQESEVIGMIGFNYRFHPLYQELKAQYADGTIGKLVAMRTIFHTASYQAPVWKEKRNTGGGVLLDLASHHIDLIEMVTGEPIVSVSAQLQSLQSEDDSAMALFELANGLFVQASFALNSIDMDCIEIVGTEGVLSVDRHHSLRVTKSSKQQLFQRAYGFRRGIRESMVGTRYAAAKFRAPHHDPSYDYALLQFVHALQLQRQVEPTFLDGYRSLAIVLATDKAAHSGKREAIGYEDLVD